MHVDQTQYVKDINPVNIDKERRKHPEEPIIESERQAFRGLIGSLQYAAVNTRPDLGSRLSMLQSRINNGQIQDLVDGNKLLHDAKVNTSRRKTLDLWHSQTHRLHQRKIKEFSLEWVPQNEWVPGKLSYQMLSSITP